MKAFREWINSNFGLVVAIVYSVFLACLIYGPRLWANADRSPWLVEYDGKSMTGYKVQDANGVIIWYDDEGRKYISTQATAFRK